jgi:DNA helicase-2/ATP-dependent DNA helicase PcrA
MTVAVDPALGLLTSEQLAAITTPAPRVFVKAEPGSGKTTVAAQRFGALRYRRPVDGVAATDARSVTAVSFTRSATWELHGRVRVSWGPSALQWPHRIVTIDTLVYEMLEHLLRVGLLSWPGGHQSLEVHDTWKVLAEHKWTRAVAQLRIDGQTIVNGVRYAAQAASRPAPRDVHANIARGVCTHEEIRAALGLVLPDTGIQKELMNRIRSTCRALIVDEVFDANALDLALVELAVRSNIDVTLVGDPWQALYGFRGARPELVPGLVSKLAVERLPLTASFRWQTHEQRSLADELRTGRGATLPSARPDDVDVVLACFWKQLWETGTHVLPLAFGSAKGNNPEAAATLLLNHLTRTVFGEGATYLADALTTLGIDDPDAVVRLEPLLQPVVDRVAVSGKGSLNAAYDDLVAAVRSESRRGFPRAHGAYTKRLALLRERLISGHRLIPGMTTHQAKGREWDFVGVRLSDDQSEALKRGLSSAEEAHRQLYVACTRARFRIYAV